jgi:hypothetical protein
MIPPLSERAIQRSVIGYLARLRIYASHSPNGSHLAGDKLARIKQWNALKADGAMPGFPDLILIARTTHGAAVGFMEIKSKTGVLSKEQQLFADTCVNDWKLPYAVVRSIDDAESALKSWGWR